jgi:hypothetical protein
MNFLISGLFVTQSRYLTSEELVCLSPVKYTKANNFLDSPMADVILNIVNKLAGRNLEQDQGGFN